MLGWELPPHNSGGLGVACLHMSKALAIKGASIDFVVPYNASHPNISFMNILSATELSPLHRYGMGAYDSSRLLESGQDVVDAVSLREVQKQYGEYIDNHLSTTTATYDAIHAHDWLTMEAGILAKEKTGLPLVVHVHATEFDRSGSERGNLLVHEIEEMGLLAADRIIAVSTITKQIIVKKYHIPADKIEVVHNALDPDELVGHEYDRRTYRYLEEMKHHGYTIVATVTRFTVQKGLVHFMKAAARACERNEKLLFLLAGDGEQRDELLQLSAELGIADKVFFTGFVRGKQWRDAYNVADVFVMSSVSEPFGITALEAAHHDSALILTWQSGVGEVLDSVFRYDFWDVDALADRIVGLASSPALISSMRTNVRNEYLRISWHDVAQHCMQLYRSLQTGALR